MTDRSFLGAWYTDLLVASDGSAFSNGIALTPSADIGALSSSDKSAIVVGPDNELWIYRFGGWRPISALGLLVTEKTSDISQVASPKTLGYVIKQDQVSPTLTSIVGANGNQVSAVTTPHAGVWMAWLYLYTASPTTAQTLSLTVNSVVIAKQQYDKAVEHASVVGTFVDSSGGDTIVFDYDTTDTWDTIRFVLVCISDYEA